MKKVFCMEYNIVVPLAQEDYIIFRKNINYIFKYLTPKKIVIIATEFLKEVIEKDFHDNEKIEFVDENKLFPKLNYTVIKQYLMERNVDSRTGWYFQQFLKMSYANVCDTEYYLTWDADTIPLKEMNLFKDKKPIFSLKKEYNEAYFDTLYNILGLRKIIKYSFIAEHMMFRKDIMIDLIETINFNSESLWFIEILNNINNENLSKSGFSEFETYGTFVLSDYPNTYDTKKMKSLRSGKKIFGEIPNQEILYWVAKYYETISFEKWDIQKSRLKVFESLIFRKVVPINIYVKLVSLEMKIYKLLGRLRVQKTNL